MHPTPRRFRLIAALALAASLSACGGGGGGGNTDPGNNGVAPAPAAPAAIPGGLYVGYYAEDAVNNPEDPMLGAFVLNLPETDTDFSGSMYFTYVGCQSSNVGTVSGSKAGASLNGLWQGSVDGLAQAGSYTGSHDTARGGYAGTYANAGGKQHRDLRPCIQYDIAALGTWEMFPIETNVPASFSVTMNGRAVSWPAVAGGQLTMVYILDPEIARGTGNPVVWQTVIGANTAAVAIPSSVALTAGRPYVAAVGVADRANTRLAFGSKRFAGL